MRKLILLLTGIVGLCLTSCGSASDSTMSSSDTMPQSESSSVSSEVVTQTENSKNTKSEEIQDVSEEAETQDNISTNDDTLVIYFSRTGNTEKIAEYLIELTDADSYMIEAAVPYSDDDIKYQDDNCRANKEQNDKTVRPEIADPIDSIESYDTIFLGYPIWWGQEPRIIDTFLESYDFSEKTVIPFCTSGSSAIATSEKNISELVTIGNQLEGRRFPAGATKDEVKEWLDMLPLDDYK